MAELDEAPSTTPFFRSPEYVGVDCHVCQTRLYGTPDQIGQSLKCPDCGKLTVLRPPPATAASKTPEAMEGEQYELAEEDKKPASAAVAPPTYIAVRCKLCDTLMYATPDRIGSKIKCPDCGKQSVVPNPPAPKKAMSVLTPDGEDYEMDAAAVSGELPVIIPHRNKMQFEMDEEAERADMSPAAVRRRKRRDSRGRVIMPRQPLLTGVLSFLFSPGVPGWWIIFSLGYLVCGFLILDGAHHANSGGPATIAALISFLLGVVPGVVLVAVTTAVWTAIITESSDGHDEIQNWNTSYILDWFSFLPYTAAAASASTVPGVLAASVVTGDWWIRAGVGLGTTIMALPIVTLSQLENNSPWGVLSGRILATLGRCPFSWILFWSETGVMLACCYGLAMVCAQHGVSPIVLTPVFAGAFLLYARLLGRLGWRLAEATAVVEK
jgi:DNA-directed RNA polymerase subunit M/transcription elongation factor TFIIS